MLGAVLALGSAYLAGSRTLPHHLEGVRIAAVSNLLKEMRSAGNIRDVRVRAAAYLRSVHVAVVPHKEASQVCAGHTNKDE